MPGWAHPASGTWAGRMGRQPPAPGWSRLAAWACLIDYTCGWDQEALRRHGAIVNWRGAHSRLRLGLTVVVGVVAGLATGVLGAWDYAALVGWDAAAATFAAWVWATIGPMDAAHTAAHARQEDPGQAQADSLLLLASVASLIAVGVVLVSASSAHGTSQALLAGLAVASVALSWSLVHTLFTLRYTRLYHSSGGGVDFHQDGPPCYADFAYLAFTIGMTFQVSDNEINTTKIRAAVLRHALLSYLFGAVILATTVNFIVGLSSGSGG